MYTYVFGFISYLEETYNFLKYKIILNCITIFEIEFHESHSGNTVDALKILFVFCVVCLLSMCVSVTSKRCGTAVSSLACGPSLTLAVHHLCPFLTLYRKFILRSAFVDVFHLFLAHTHHWNKNSFNSEMCTFFFCRWVKWAYSAADHQDWPKMWRKHVSRWTRRIKLILFITMRTSSCFGCLVKNNVVSLFQK